MEKKILSTLTMFSFLNSFSFAESEVLPAAQAIQTVPAVESKEQSPAIAKKEENLSTIAALPVEPAKAEEILSQEKINLYLKAYGFLVAKSSGVTQLSLSDVEAQKFCEGVISACKKEEIGLKDQEEIEKMQQFFMNKKEANVANNKRLSDVFLKTKDSEEGIVKTVSGLRYKVLKAGDSVRADDDCTVVIDYEGKLVDGKIFDSSYERKERAKFYVGSLIPGFSEALKLIGNGGEIEAYIPSDLGYGDNAIGPIDAGSLLIFNIKMHEIIKPTSETKK